MCRQLTEIREAIGRFAKCFDARLLLGDEAARVVDEAAAGEEMIAAVKALAVARVDEAKRWGDAPYRSPAEALSHRTGISKTEAKDIVDAGKRLVQQPDLADAALAGKFSSAQTSSIAEAVQADPRSDRRLIEATGEASLAELKIVGAHEGSGHRPGGAPTVDPQAPTVAVLDRPGRRLAPQRLRQPGGRGAGHGRSGSHPGRDLRQARKQGRRESPDTYAFDSLVQLAVESTSEGDDAPASTSESRLAWKRWYGQGRCRRLCRAASRRSRRWCESHGQRPPSAWPRHR